MALNLFSCAVRINDETFYVDAGSLGAVTVNLLTPGSEIVPPDQWNPMREGMFCMSPQSFGDIKTEIEELCSKTTCSYQVKQALQGFTGRVERAQNHGSFTD